MTLALRKIFLTSGAVLGLIFFLVFCAGIVSVAQNADGAPGAALTASMIWTLSGVGMTALFSVVGGFGFRRLFRRTASLEIFFFLAFIVSLSFDALKILNLVFIAFHAAPYYGTIVTRVAYFGYFLGLLSLFASSLFSGDSHYQKMGTILGIILAFSISLAYTLPIDSTVFHANLLYRVSGEEFILLVRFGLEILTLFSFGRSAFLSGTAEQRSILGAAVMVILGRELLFFLSSPLFIMTGSVLLVGGSILFSRNSYAKHLWI
jgi:hypothetical protein